MTPSVSVVIPTIGRESVVRAVRSAADQTYPVSIIVVVDDPTMASTVTDWLADLDAKILTTSGRIGGSGARNLGADATASDLIAFLDDDDWWEPTKIEKQVASIKMAGPRTVAMSATSMYFHRKGDVQTIPSIPFSEREEDAASYLVTRSKLRFGNRAMQTSGLLVSRGLYDIIRWDETLPKHQDWDYIARAARVDGLIFGWVPEPLVHVQQDSHGSISKESNYKASLGWLRTHEQYMTRRARADFVCTHVLRAALNQRSLPGVRESLVELVRTGRPHCAAIVVGLSGLR